MAASNGSGAGPCQVCDQCGASFGSRNQLFKHLKDCGKEPSAPAVAKTAVDHRAVDHDALLVALKGNGSVLEFASGEQRDDESICTVAVRQNGKALKHASLRLQAEPTVVLEAVRQNGCALQFANESLRSDRAVAMAAVKQNRKALEFCGPSLRNDPSFTAVALQRRGRTGVGPHSQRHLDSTAAGAHVNQRYKKLWIRRPGWHQAAAREKAGADLNCREIAVALEQAVTVSCARKSSSRPRLCRSCGAGASSADNASQSGVPPCWACSGQTVLGLVLRTAGTLSISARDRANVAQACTTWRTQCFLSRLPSKMLTEQAGREWLQEWDKAFERCLEMVPTAMVGNTSLAPIDVKAGEALHMALKHVCTRGVMPDFSHSGALAHYAVENLTQRAQKTTAALLLDEARPLLTSLLLSPTRPTLRVAAVGGGPGFEAVGLAVLANFLRVAVEVECLSMDIEPGWGPVLAAVVGGTRDLAGKSCCDVVQPECLRAGDRPGLALELEPEPEQEQEQEQEHEARLAPRHRVAFVASDCLTGRAGSELLLAAPTMDLFTFNYCMVENAKALRADNFSYLRKVFAAATAGAVFIFMDAAYHLWQEVVEVFGSLSDGNEVDFEEGDSGGKERGPRFAVLHPDPQPWQCTSTMIVTKLC